VPFDAVLAAADDRRAVGRLVVVDTAIDVVCARGGADGGGGWRRAPSNVVRKVAGTGVSAGRHGSHSRGDGLLLCKDRLCSLDDQPNMGLL